MIVSHTRAAALLMGVLSFATPAGALDLPQLMPSCTIQVQNDDDRVHIITPVGQMLVQLFPSAAPGTVANFLNLINTNAYDNVSVHRSVPGFVIQTGGFRFSGTTYEPIEEVPTVDNEPCISNLEGTIAMAKLGGQPNSATSEWFVSLADNSGNLDSQNGGFTVFGRLLTRSSKSTSQRIAALQTLGALSDPDDEMSPLLLPELPVFYADVLFEQFDMFRGSPVVNLPTIDSPTYGCFDSDQAGVLLIENPQSSSDWEPDAVRGLPYSIVSMACSGVGGAGAPSIPCSPPGRRVLLMDPETGGFTPDPSAEFFFQETVLACDDIAASEASLDARLTDIGSQLDAGLMKFDYHIQVPEPGASASGTAALLSLASLAYRSRRSRG